VVGDNILNHILCYNLEIFFWISYFHNAKNLSHSKDFAYEPNTSDSKVKTNSRYEKKILNKILSINLFSLKESLKITSKGKL